MSKILINSGAHFFYKKLVCGRCLYKKLALRRKHFKELSYYVLEVSKSFYELNAKYGK